MWNLIIKILTPLTGLWILCKAHCVPVYGGPPCTFLPAPPGKTPPCARPGDTFCELVKEYPMQHIQYLIEQWNYDYSTLFSSEIREDFNTYFRQPDYNYGYNYEPEPIYIPKPNQVFQEIGNKYIPPAVNYRQNYTDNFIGYPDRKPAVKYATNNQIGTNVNFRNNHHNNNHFIPSQNPNTQFRAYNGQQPQQQLSYLDPNNWWRYNRHATQTYLRAKRSGKLNKIEQNSTNIITTDIENRKKRQTGRGVSQQLCQTRSQYIMPKAALNNKGNWMYVVNLQEVDNRITQFVRSETCISQQCSGLCSLPTGYTSRCEQKYVQKRLVALEAAGQNLYTDIFWFPSCCICTITN